MANYFTKKMVHVTYERFMEALTNELYKEGFVVLSIADVRKSLKENLSNGITKQEVISVIHPFLYTEVVKDFPGVVLPCQISLWEPKKGSIEIMALNSLCMISSASKNPSLENIADEITRRLNTTIENVSRDLAYPIHSSGSKKEDWERSPVHNGH
jgi:uncharacterized protein (DUF302 family)